MPRGQRRPSGGLRTSLGAVSAALILFLLDGCSSGMDSGTTSSRDAGVYRAVIADLADELELHAPTPDAHPIVFIESFAPDGVSLEVQVDLVAEFDDTYDLRFVDERAEAIDDNEPNRPVRRNGALLGLGPILDDDPLTVRVELYADELDIRAYRYSLREGSGEWNIAGPPESVAPEGFVGPP